MADIYSLNVDTGTVYIRALPGEDLSGWVIVSYGQSGNGSEPVDGNPVDTSTPYVADPLDGYYYYKQELGLLDGPSGQRHAIVLVDDEQDVIDTVGWGKDEDFPLVGGPGDGINISPGDGNYAPGDGPWYTDGPPWETTQPPDLQPLPPPCFVAGTLIDTPSGQIPIEHLQNGDLVTTTEGAKPIIWVGNSNVRLDSEHSDGLQPVRFAAGSLGFENPKNEVLLSQQHRVYFESSMNELLFGVSGVLVPAKFLINGYDITLDTTLIKVDYYHILLDGHFLVYANGLRAETLLLGEWVFSKSSLQAFKEFKRIFSDRVSPSVAKNFVSSTLVLKKYESELLKPK